jgi:hypothetical protein
MGIRKVFIEITGAEGLEIRAKVGIIDLELCSMLIQNKVLEKFETQQLAHLGRKITQMVRLS